MIVKFLDKLGDKLRIVVVGVATLAAGYYIVVNFLDWTIHFDATICGFLFAVILYNLTDIKKVVEKIRKLA